MENEEIINALSVLSSALKAAKLEYKIADKMIEDLKKNPVYQESELQRAFCACFICNLKSMADFDGERIVSKYESFKNSGFL